MLEEATEVAKEMGKDLEDEGAGEGDEDAWVEWVQGLRVHGLWIIYLVISSEEDEAMDEDATTKEKGGDDDLAKYNLDDYDKESKSICA